MRRFCLVLLLGVVGCGPTVELLKLNDAIQAAEVAKAENSFGETYITLRSFRTDDAGEKIEFAGAKCSGRNELISFKGAVTPVRVKVPTYLQGDRFDDRGKPADLRITCKYEGETLTNLLEALSGVQNRLISGTASFNPSTGIYSQPQTVVLSGRLSSTLPWVFPNLNIEF